MQTAKDKGISLVEQVNSDAPALAASMIAPGLGGALSKIGPALGAIGGALGLATAVIW